MVEMAVLAVEFFLDGCSSLKEKRQRLGGLQDRFGRLQNVAVLESDFQDDHRRSQWTFAIIANQRTGIEKTVEHIESRLEQEVDGRVVSSDLSWL